MTRAHLRPRPGPQSQPAPSTDAAHASPAQSPPAQSPPESRRSGAPSACCWRRASLSLPWFSVVLWRRGQADCRPLGAAARFNAIIAAGKSTARRAVRAIYRSSGRGGDSTTASSATGNATASNIPGPGSGRAARSPRRQHAAAPPGSNAVAANDRARSRESGANHRTAQGEPAANGQRQFKSHRGAQGEPGRDETRAREGFRADPAQTAARHRLRRSRLRPCAGPSGRSAAAGESAASILPEGSGSTTTIGSRRRGDHRNSCPATTPRRDTERGAHRRCIADRLHRAIRTALLSPLPPHPTCQFREAGAACSHG